MVAVGLAPRVPWTYADLGQMQEDGRRYEIIDGELYMNPAPSTAHQSVVGELYYELMRRIQKEGLGRVFVAPIDVILSNQRVVEPDLLVIKQQRQNIISERGIEGAPDLIVEVLSPSTRDRDLGIKRKLYANEGVPEYWIADPGASAIEILELKDQGYQQAGRFGPGQQLQSIQFDLPLRIDVLFSR